jgi:hypothetical protein
MSTTAFYAITLGPLAIATLAGGAAWLAGRIAHSRWEARVCHRLRIDAIEAETERWLAVGARIRTFSLQRRRAADLELERARMLETATDWVDRGHYAEGCRLIALSARIS